MRKKHGENFSLISMILIVSAVFITEKSFSQSWSQLPDFPGTERDDATAVTCNNYGYFGTGFGAGFVTLNDWWKFDPFSETWTQLTSLPGVPRQYASSVAIHDTIYIFGGIDQNGNALNELWAYSVHTDSWHQRKTFPGGGRQSPVFFRSHNSIVCGMGRTGTSYFNDLWIFEPTSNIWPRKKDFPFGKRFEANGYSVNGYWGIGNGKNNTNSFTDWYWYDPVADSWKKDFTYSNNSVYYSAANSSIEGVFIYGGLDASNNFSNQLFQFSSSQKKWNELTSFPSIERRGASLLAFPGKIFLICGLDPSNNRLKELWKYDFSKSQINFNLFPNPAQTQINISSVDGFTGEELIEIFSITGKMVQQIQPEKKCELVTIDIPSLKKGFYLVFIIKDEEVLHYAKILVVD